MTPPIDSLSFVSVLLRGLVLAVQSLTVGGVVFVCVLAAPLCASSPAPAWFDRAARLLRRSAFALAGAEAVALALQAATLAQSLHMDWAQALNTTYAAAGLTVMLAALAIAALATHDGLRRRAAWLIVAALVVLTAQLACSHAAARVDHRAALAVADFAHMAGASVWIGGLPYLGLALAGTADAPTLAWIGGRYSRLSIVSVAVLAGAGVVLAVGYVGSLQALYGTDYGVILVTKGALFAGLLLLGAMNKRLVRRFAAMPGNAVMPVRRYLEVELGIGLTVMMAAASLTSQTPGIDLAGDRASAAQIVERITPRWPRMSSPPHRLLSASVANASAVAPSEPGESKAPERNMMDIAWSEFNHHWSGLLVCVIGVLALLERTGRAPWARHWPLLLAALAVPLFIRSDPEVWPMGRIGFLESLGDPEVLQHRLLVAVTAAFGIVEWRTRTGRVAGARAALIFPLLCAVGATMLLTHSHALTDAKDQLLVQITHVPLALAILTAGWARWIEVRSVGRAARVAGAIWPAAFVVSGLCLLLYREQ